MTRLDGLYTISCEGRSGDSGGAHLFGVAIDPRHEIFRGHFPGRPVLPGVCTLRIVRNCLETVLGHGVRYETIRNCKFSSMIVPGDGPVSVSLTVDGEGNAFQASVGVGERAVLKLKATYIR